MSAASSVLLRRLAAGAAALAAAGVLAACGDDDEPTAGDPSAQRTQAERTRTTARGDQGGAQVQGDPGSASLNPTPDGGAGALGLGSESSTGVVRPFNDQSPWNTPVDSAPVDRRSAQWIRLVKQRVGVVETRGTIRREPREVNDGLYVNTRKFTVPIVDEEGAQPTRVVCRQLPPYCGDGADVDELMIPPDVDPLPQYDGWYTVLDRSQGVAYDLWRARRGGDGDVLSYQFMRKWELNGPGFQEPNTVSARGSGLPLFAGVILPEEIRAGRIDHALAISLPGPAQRNYVQPASATDGNGDLQSLPEGARIRLRDDVQLTFRRCPRDFDERVRRAAATRTLEDDRALPRCFPDRTNRRAARAIFEALRRYGAIVVDRSRVPSMYAKLNFDWSQPLRDEQGRLLDGAGRPLSRSVRRLPNQGTPLLRGNEVEQLRIDDFEVVQVRGPILKFPPLDATPVAGRGQTGRATTTSGATTASPGDARPQTAPHTGGTFGPPQTTETTP